MSSQQKFQIRTDSGSRQTLSERVINENLIDVYISNIPNDLTKDGLLNIFVEAGTIDSVHIKRSKIQDSPSTYGFVRYRTKTAAMQAIQKFNGMKLGQQTLKVRLAKPVGKTETAPQNHPDKNNNSFDDCDKQSKSANRSVAHIDSETENIGMGSTKRTGRKTNTDRDSDAETVYSVKSAGRGHIVNALRESRMLNLSRPYARRIYTRQMAKKSISRSGSSSNSSSSEYEQVFKQLDPSKRGPDPSKYSVESVRTQSRTDSPSIITRQGSRQSKRLATNNTYEVEIKCAYNPSYFYIQTLDSTQKTAYIMNNMDNCYRNEDILIRQEFQTGDLCAFQIDSYWYRGKIISRDVTHYVVRAVDFGDIYKISIKDAVTLKEEFADVEFCAIRCALSGVRPYMSSVWCPEAVDLVKDLVINDTTYKILNKTSDKLYAKIVDYDFDANNEEICLVQVFLTDESELFSDYLLVNRWAEVDDSTTGRVSRTSERADMSASVDALSNTTRPFYQKTTCTLVNSFATSAQRTKLFNCTFKIYKWRDLKKTKLYKCSHFKKVNVSYVESTQNFYVQDVVNMPVILNLEKSLENYARVFINNCDMLFDELYNYMLHTSKYDVVIAKCPLDHKWKRAVILGLVSFDNNGSDPLTYFKVFYIDYGSETLISYDRRFTDVYDKIVILPLNDKLILIEPYALKCSLKRIDFARNKSLLDDLGERVHNENFRKKFVEIIKNHTRLGKSSAIKNLTMNIIQVESSRYMQEAIVDLHMETSDDKCVNIIDYIQKCLPDEETGRFDDCDQVEDDQRSSEVTSTKLNSKVKKLMENTASDEANIICNEKKSQKTTESRPSVQPETVQHAAQAASAQQREPVDTHKKPAVIEPVKSVEEAKKPDSHKDHAISAEQAKSTSIQEKKSNGHKEQVESGSKRLARVEIIPVHRFTNLKPYSTYKLSMQFVDEAANFIYFSLYDNLEKLNSLQELLQATSNNEFITDLNDIQSGSVFEAQYQVDMKWYRVILQERIDNSTIKIYFVDYGNTETYDTDMLKTAKCLRKSTPTSLDLKYQAIKCTYKTHMPDSVERFFSDAVEKLVDDLYFYMKITDVHDAESGLIKQKVYNVDFSNDQETDQEIIDIMQPMLEIQENKILQQKKRTINELGLKQDEVHECLFSFTNTLNDFYVQKVSSTSEIIAQQDIIQQAMENMKAKLKATNKFNVNDYVLAQYSADTLWYRGLITDVLADNEYQVFFVDYGNCEQTRSECLLSIYDVDGLDYKTVEYPFQAIWCKLDFSETLNEKFQDLMLENDGPTQVKIKRLETVDVNKTCYLVDLYANGVHINEALKPPAPKPVPEKIFKLGEKRLDLNGTYECKMVYADDPTEIYSMLCSFEAELVKLDELLNKEDNIKKFQSIKVRMPVDGDLVLAKFFVESENQHKWYRARIIKCHAENKYDVMFVDYGNCELSVDIKDLCYVSEALASQYAITLQAPMVYCTELLDFDMDADVELLKEFLGMDTYNMKVCKYNADANKYVVDICGLRKEKVKIAKLKIEQLPVQTLDEESTYLLYYKRLSEFYLFNEPIIIDIQAQVQAICEPLLATNVAIRKAANYKPELGDLCFGKYDEDEQWYRCKITNLTENSYDKFEVFFIDFGNTEVLKADEILFPYENTQHLNIFMNYPAQAFKSCLHGFNAHTDDKTAKNVQFADAFREFAVGNEFSVKIIAKEVIPGNKNMFYHHVQMFNRKAMLDTHKYLFESTDSFDYGKEFVIDLVKQLKTSDNECSFEFILEQFKLLKTCMQKQK